MAHDADDKRLWESEPQVEYWIDDASGYGCAIVRHTRLKHLCGYVGVPMSHPWAGKDYDNMRMAHNEWPEVHGGLTYAADHAPKEKPDGHWWLGFDCAHAGDLVPAMEDHRSFSDDETYKDWSYVKREVVELARQAKQTEKAMEIAP